ncbi:hypothetical protein HC928_05010 [bacterium]|nr:hypothetical protein [bacterium]
MIKTQSQAILTTRRRKKAGKRGLPVAVVRYLRRSLKDEKWWVVSDSQRDALRKFKADILRYA